VPDVAAEVVGEIDHADLHLGSPNADGAHEQPDPRLLMREDMLDERTDLRAASVGARGPIAHRPALRLLVVDVGDVAALVEPASFFFERYALSAHTFEPVLPRSSTLQSCAPS